MLRQKYNAHRDNVVDIANVYLNWREQNRVNDGIDFNFFKKRIENLEKGRFVLAIAGEVKAGKSTFINALLGTDLLPSGSLQATSAIIKIFKSDKSLLKIKYASGREEVICEENANQGELKLKEKIKALCSIPEEYREIPTTLINEYIINFDSKITVQGDLLNDLEEKSGLDLKEYKDKIADYLNKFDKDTIATEIQLGYPIEWQFSDMILVDTPGVNATGGIENTTFNFINHADAIIFVKPIKPVESKSFQNFVEKNILNRNKQMVFLVLTHTIDNIHDKDTLLKETKRLYNHIINEEKIIAVDSILKQIHTDILKGKTTEEIKNESPIKKSKIPLLKDLAEEEKIDFQKACLEYSGFEQLKKTIDKFTEEAPTLRLLEILEKIHNGYDNENNQYDEKIERLRLKAQDPQKYESELKRLRQLLNELENDYRTSIQDFKNKYKGINADYINTIENFYNNYIDNIDQAMDIYALRKISEDFTDESKGIVSDIYKNIEEYLKQIFRKLSKDYKNNNNITIPSIDLDKIEKEAEEKAIEKELDWGGLDKIVANMLSFFNLTDPCYKKKKNDKKFLSETKISLKEQLSKIKNDIKMELGNAIDNFLNVLDKEFSYYLDERKKHLDEEYKKKQNNEEILKEIEELNQKKRIVQSNLKKIIELKEDMK